MFSLLSKYQCAKDLFLPIAAFILLLLFSAIFIHFCPESGWSTIVALLPLIPAIWAVRTTVRLVTLLETAQQVKLLVNFATSFVVVGLLTFAYGFLTCFADYPSLPLIMVAPLMVVVWIATSYVMCRRCK
ncbi:hypothetical protein MAQ5080_01315 [Marinomonas aquimarina]|uniref:Uncharacterized protein n=1 Tax=Marinomonas aquimarina TaxID=295068 RepID=A0A1A8TC25_9GAMM|nr:hypothetical protein [Marinomonas aquimarina]SBS29166.1 hypothetical protein MAQ5080_01315 [Marinomonas aquimarina]